jgi:hypothetical protein
MVLYLNNSGDRWIDTSTGAMNFVLVLPDGTRKLRKADYFYSFGNFAGIAYRFQGRRYMGLPKASDGSEIRLGNETGLDKLPHIFHKE